MRREHEKKKTVEANTALCMSKECGRFMLEKCFRALAKKRPRIVVVAVVP